MQRFELGRHLLHGVRKFGQLSRDRRYVVRSCDFTAILRPETRAPRRSECYLGLDQGESLGTLRFFLGGAIVGTK